MQLDTDHVLVFYNFIIDNINFFNLINPVKLIFIENIIPLESIDTIFLPDIRMKQQFNFLSMQNISTFFQIFSSSALEGLQDYDIDLEKFMNYIKYFNIKEDTSFILLENSKPIGLFLGAIRGKSAYIPAVVVTKDYRRQGYGRVLLQKGVSLLMENDCQTVRLEVLQTNTSAINLYNSEGFQIKKEIINYRIENNYFYTKNTIQNYKVINANAFTFHFLNKMFHREKLPWQRGLSSILARIDDNECELFLIQKNDITCAYIVISRKNNCLQIHDIGLKENEYHLFAYFISSILKGEKIVQANSFYSKDPHCKLFEQNGFFIDKKQYEMKRKLS